MAVREAEPIGSLQEVHEVGLDREDLFGMYRSMLTARGIEERGHILYKQGKIPGSFYTGRGNEASAVGVGSAMGPDDVGCPLQRGHGRPHHPRRRAVAHLCAVHGTRQDGPTQGRDGNVHIGDARLGLHAMVSHLPAMLPVAVGMGARLQDPRGAPRGDRLVRRGRCCPRRRPRGNESRRRAPAPRRVRDRQQPVGVLDPCPSRPRRRAPRRPRRGLRIRGRRRRRHRCARGLPRGQARDREGPRGRRPDADRVGDAAHGRARRPRRRVVRAARDVRGVGAPRPRRAVPDLAARQRLDDPRGGGRDLGGRQEAPQRLAPAGRGIALCRIRPRSSTAFMRPPTSSRPPTTSNGREDLPPGDQRRAPAGDASRPRASSSSARTSASTAARSRSRTASRRSSASGACSTCRSPRRRSSPAPPAPR